MVAEIHKRLSDYIYSALDLALEQKDYEIASLLVQSIELSMTRSAGGGGFVERRDYPEKLEKAMVRLEELKAGKD